MHRTMKAILFLVCFNISMSALTAGAHESSSGDVLISHPWAAPAKAGGNTRLYLTIENEEQEQITLMTLATPVSRETRFSFRSDSETVLTLGSRSIRSEETLNLASHHMWFELIGLRRDLVIGSEFEAILTFADGRKVTLTVIVGRSVEIHGVG